MLKRTLLAAAALALTASSVSATQVGWKTYSDMQAGYTISYPAGWKVDPHYRYGGFGPDHEIRGVAFEIPASLARGTNLSTSLTGVSVEVANGHGKCDATRFLPDPQEPRTLHNAGRVWSTANMQDAGAGNLYDIAVFAITNSKPCIAVRYTIHSTNIGNYDPGTVRAFNYDALVRVFSAIRRSIKLEGER
jgi:hypothetical protein